MALRSQRGHRREARTLVGRIWVRLVEPPVRLRLKVPAAALQPGEIESRELLLARFDETHATLIALLDESDAYDRMRVRIPTPFAKARDRHAARHVSRCCRARPAASVAGERAVARN
jgi:hypothetical protein